MVEKSAYQNDVEVQWCPGCPNYGIRTALIRALVQLELSPSEVCLVSGIGQAAKLPHYMKAHFFNGLHGRALPAAAGILAANPRLKTFVTTGDGDAYGEGGNHFLHNLRRNLDITVIVHNNEIYALTKGQASPTTQPGARRALLPEAVAIPPLNMPAVAILHGCGFVARGFAGDPDHLAGLIEKAARHRGFAYIDVLQPCITWGKHPLSWYRERVYQMEDHDPSDWSAAIAKTREWGERFPIGVLYEGSPGPVFGERFREVVSGEPLATLSPPTAKTIEGFMPKNR
jgi:2-oxoglutarate ferredoxin oxidoreductase subunit beta